jgi:SsrA-binding protein
MVLIANKKAGFEYEITSTVEAGVILSGAEVKSLRAKSGSLAGSYVKIIGSEAFLLNAQITPYSYADNSEYDPKRTRKLLLHKRELVKLAEAQDQKGITLVPLSFELSGKFIKLKVGVGRGRKVHEKREVLKRRDVERDIRREIKDKVRMS